MRRHVRFNQQDLCPLRPLSGYIRVMTDRIYYSALLHVPAVEVPDDMTAVRRPFAILRHGGMIAFRIGPVDVQGSEGDDYTVLISTSQANKVIETLELIRANLGR